MLQMVMVMMWMLCHRQAYYYFLLLQVRVVRVIMTRPIIIAKKTKNKIEVIKYRMNKQIPYINPIVHRRQVQRNNQLLMFKLMNIKHSNISALDRNSKNCNNKEKNRKLEKIKNNSAQQPSTHQLYSALYNSHSPPPPQYQIVEANRKMLGRLVQQKSTVLKVTALAQQRKKNVQYLKRIGKYPYHRQRIASVNLERQICSLQKQQGGIASNKKRQLKTQYYGDIQEEEQEEREMNRSKTDQFIVKPIDPITHSRHHINLSGHNNLSVNTHRRTLSAVQQPPSPGHPKIVLYTRILPLSLPTPLLYRIIILRQKHYYSLQLIQHPQQNHSYHLQLPQAEGTLLFNFMDYDYDRICGKHIKNNGIHICLNYEPTKGKKKWFRFQKKNRKATVQEQGRRLQSNRERQEMEEGGHSSSFSEHRLHEHQEQGQQQLRVTQFARQLSHSRLQQSARRAKQLQKWQQQRQQTQHLKMTHQIDIHLSRTNS